MALGWTGLQMVSKNVRLFALLFCGIASGASAATGGIIPADRATTWNPGLAAVGGIPARSKICATVSPRGSGLDDTLQIQTAINGCPEAQVVKLTKGNFIISEGNFLLINKGITLRGAGPGRTG